MAFCLAEEPYDIPIIAELLFQLGLAEAAENYSSETIKEQ